MGVSTISLTAYLIYFFLYNSQLQVCYPTSRQKEFIKCNLSIKDPVCALYFGKGCKNSSGFCKKTIDNKCGACFDESVIAYLPGSCDNQDFTRCKDQSNLRCNAYAEDYVCAFVKEQQGCKSPLYPKTIINSCVACSSDDIFFYTPGKCAEEPSGICRPEARNAESCTKEYEPQCTYYRDGKKVWRQTTSNKCNACMGSNTVFYVPGECEYAKES